MAKVFYWLKLKDDFFQQKEIKKLRKIAGGDTYTIIYLKLLLLSMKNSGCIEHEGVEDDFSEELSLMIDEEAENIRLTLGFLQKHGMLEIMGSQNYILPKSLDMYGSESEAKERVKNYRNRKKIRDTIELKLVKKLSYEMIGLPDGSTKYIDNKRYGGNAEYVYELARCKCEICEENNSKLLVIHHNNGYSNDLEDLYLLCKKCHSNVENGNIFDITHSYYSVTCNSDVTASNNEVTTSNTQVTECNTEKRREELEKEKEKKDIKPTVIKIDELLKTFSFSESLQSKIKEWFSYKKEKRQEYKPTGAKSLITQIHNKLKELSEEQTIYAITESMACNYQGIIWDKAKNYEKGGAYGNAGARDTRKDIEPPKRKLQGLYID